MKDFRKLAVWEKAHHLTLDIYRVTGNFPQYEVYGLTSQMRRSAASIPMNIAEGCGRETDADFARFLQIDMGSASELEYQLILTHDLRMLDETVYPMLATQTAEVKRMLTGFLKKLKADR